MPAPFSVPNAANFPQFLRCIASVDQYICSDVKRLRPFAILQRRPYSLLVLTRLKG